MKFVSSSEIAEKWNVTDRRVRMLCAEGKVQGAFLVGKTWHIPENAEKPKRANAKPENLKSRIKKVEIIKTQLDNLRPLTSGEFKSFFDEINKKIK